MSGLWEHQKPFLPLSSPQGCTTHSSLSPCLTLFQLNSVPSVHALVMLWGAGFSFSPSQPCLEVSTLWAYPQSSHFGMDLPSNHGFCLTLIFTRPDPVPDLWIDFPALHWTCIITMNLCRGVTSWLEPADLSKPVLLPLLCYWLVRSLGAVYFCPSSLRCQNMLLPNIFLLFLRLHAFFLVQTTSTLQFYLL